MNKVYLELDDIVRLEQAAENLRDKLLVRTLFHLGCRISEALGITPNDVNLHTGTITILHLKMRMTLLCPECNTRLGKTYTFCPKCGAIVETIVAKAQEHRRQRLLPIDPDTLEMFKEYIKRGGPVTKNGQTLVFGVNRHRAWYIIKECADKAGLPKLVNPETGRIHNVSPHKLRDAFAVHAVKQNDSGDGLRLLQEHLGHASFNTTAKYRKVSGEEHRQWYQKLWNEGNS